MSWQPYVDDSLISEGFCHACILSHKGQTWASSPKFKVWSPRCKNCQACLTCSPVSNVRSFVALLCSHQVSSSEAKAILPALEGEVDAENALKEKGFTVAGTRYALNRLENEDDEVRYLIGRCKQTGTPSRGVIVARTARTLIFGVHDPIYARDVSFAKCSVSMYQLADMLMGMSF